MAERDALDYFYASPPFYIPPYSPQSSSNLRLQVVPWVTMETIRSQFHELKNAESQICQISSETLPLPKALQFKWWGSLGDSAVRVLHSL